ncbi:MAG: hypothetical protein VYD90_10255 [Pseudomonadota bacterium]|nr:hypothetical protein [Pseudomonadota bacterium]
MAGYESRIMPQAATVAPALDAQSFGAGFGAQLAQAGDEAHRREVRRYQLERQQTADQEASSFAHAYALHRQNMDGFVQQLRTNPTRADYGEHVAQVEEADQAARAAMLDGITETSVRMRAEQQLDDYRVRLVGQEGEFAAGQRAAKTRLDAQAVMDLGANRVRHADNFSTWTGEIEDWHGYVEGLQGITPAQKQAFIREGEQAYTVSFVNHLNDTDPASALAQLDKGVFDSFLSAAQIDQLRSGSQVEMRRLEAAAAHEANLQKAAARESIATLKEKASQGIDVSADLPGAIAAAQAMDDTSTVAELQGLVRDNAFARTWGASPPLAREQRLLALKGKPAGERSEDEQAEIKWLTDKKSSLDSQFDSDPVAFAAATAPDGYAPPAIVDWTPTELQAREAWMRKASGAYGSMRPLSGAEVSALQERASANDQGYRKVLASLGKGFSGRTAMQAVRQVLPGDNFASTAVALYPALQRQALDGRDLRKANPGILKPLDDKEGEAIARLKAGFHQMLRTSPAAQREGIIDVAEAISADALNKNGLSSDQMTRAMMLRTLDSALGSRGEGAAKTGGIGFWGGHMYLVPDGVTKSGFERAVTRALSGGATPVNPDGSPASLRNAAPVAIGGGKYQFYVGQRLVMASGNKPFVLTVKP